MFRHVLADENKTAFCDVYQQACRIADENLIARTSRYLRSIQTDLNSEEYFYNIFRPFVESMISELSRRFNSHFQKVATISDLLPINVVNSNITCPSDARARFDTVAQLYEIDLQHSADVVSQEIFMWALKWKQTDFLELPSSIDETLPRAKDSNCRNVRTLLKIFLTIPCTTAFVERTFSDLKRLKTYLRNSCGADRLTRIAMMALHRDTPVDYKLAVDRLLADAPRR